MGKLGEEEKEHEVRELSMKKEPFCMGVSQCRRHTRFLILRELACEYVNGVPFREADYRRFVICLQWFDHSLHIWC